MGRVAFMKEPKGSRGDAPQTPICNLNVALQDNITPDVPGLGDTDSLAAIQNKVIRAWYKELLYDTCHFISEKYIYTSSNSFLFECF